MIRREVTIGDCRLLLGDCREILPLIAGGGGMAVVTDPPYGLGRKMQGGTWGAKDGFKEMLEWDAEPPAAELVRDVVAAGDTSILWGGQYFDLPPARCWLIWNKTNAVPTMADFEMAWTNLDRPAKRFNAPVGRVEFGHPTQKPLPLMMWTLGFVPEGLAVLDPFMGSGTTGVACVKLGRRFVGIEIDERYFETAVERVRKAYEQPDLFVPRSAAAHQETLL